MTKIFDLCLIILIFLFYTYGNKNWLCFELQVHGEVVCGSRYINTQLQDESYHNCVGSLMVNKK